MECRAPCALRPKSEARRGAGTASKPRRLALRKSAAVAMEFGWAAFSTALKPSLHVARKPGKQSGYHAVENLFQVERHRSELRRMHARWFARPPGSVWRQRKKTSPSTLLSLVSNFQLSKSRSSSRPAAAPELPKCRHKLFCTSVKRGGGTIARVRICVRHYGQAGIAWRPSALKRRQGGLPAKVQELLRC